MIYIYIDMHLTGFRFSGWVEARLGEMGVNGGGCYTWGEICRGKLKGGNKFNSLMETHKWHVEK